MATITPLFTQEITNEILESGKAAEVINSLSATLNTLRTGSLTRTNMTIIIAFGERNGQTLRNYEAIVAGRYTVDGDLWVETATGDAINVTAWVNNARVVLMVGF